MKRSLITLLSLISLTGCLDKNDGKPPSSHSPADLATINFTPLFPSLSFQRPVAAIQAKNSDWYVVEQGGVVYRIPANTEEKQAFMDLSDKIKSRGEMGLLGFALDPKYSSNGIFYISYTGYDNHSYISRMYANEYDVDPTAEEIILKLSQPYSNHNGGQITFGPDNYLYIGFGDGGSAGDPDDNGQNINTLLGAILRLNVSNSSTYSIPDDNPFINKEGKDEIYAYGLRNPWRWSFDKVTGDLWLADVGQNAREEINIIEAGKNYGWNIMEGKECFTVGPCEPSSFAAPIFDYGHDEGQSITGGYVYHGNKLPALSGWYIYGDFISGKLWGLKRTENEVTNKLLDDTSFNISSFAQDNNGEIYVIDYNGKIYALTSP